MLTGEWRVAGLAVVTALTVLITGGTAVAQESASATLAQQLAAALDGAQLDSVAAKDSEGDDRFVAALFFPGRLLVVSARYEAPIYVETKIETQNYREVYIDLNTASIAGSKVLITDGGANGLVAGDPADSADMGGSVVRFDAARTAQHGEADAVYARMLRALLSEVN